MGISGLVFQLCREHIEVDRVSPLVGAGTVMLIMPMVRMMLIMMLVMADVLKMMVLMVVIPLRGCCWCG